MAKKIDINSILMTTVMLFVICAVVTAALAGTNLLTAERIALLTEQTENASRSEIINADNYKKNSITAADILSFDGESPNETDVTYYEAVKDGQTIGYIITSAANGYGGDISVMTGVDLEGKIVGLKVLSADDETPGLGQNVTKTDFQQKFIGVTKDKNTVDTLTGASYSSRAVIKCSNYALYIADKAMQSEVTAEANDSLTEEENTAESEEITNE